MASACALAMFSGKNIFIFVVQKRLRAFLNHFFTRGVWERTSPVAYGDIFPRSGQILPAPGRNVTVGDKERSRCHASDKKGSTGTATAVTEGVVFFFFLENATFLQKKLQFFLEKGRFPIDSLVIIGM